MIKTMTKTCYSFALDVVIQEQEKLGWSVLAVFQEEKHDIHQSYRIVFQREG